MKQLLLFVLATGQLMCMAQTQIFQDLSSDSVALGQLIELQYTIKGAQADFTAPQEVEGLVLISGPNHSSSMSMINGVVKQEQSLNYILKVVDAESHRIGRASVNLKDHIISIPEFSLSIVAEPKESGDQYIRVFHWSETDNEPKQSSGKKKKKFVKI